MTWQYKRHRFCIFFDNISTWSLYILAFSIPISKAMVEITATLAIITWFLKKIVGADFKITNTPINLPLAAFVIISGLSVVFSTNFKLSLGAFLWKWSEYILIAVVVIETITRPARMNKVIWALLFSAILVSTDGIYQYFFGRDFLRNYILYAGRITATFTNANDVGSYTAAILPLLAVMSISAKGGIFRKKILFIVGAVLTFSCLLMSLSRGAWLGFIAAFLLVTFLKYRKIFFVAVIVLTIFIAVAAIAPKTLAFRGQPLFRLESANSHDISTPHRLGIWTAAMRMLNMRPFLGLGLGTYMYNYPFYRLDASGEIIYAHNCFLQIAAETGIFGLVTFLWLIFSLFTFCIRNIRLLNDSFLNLAGIGLLGGILANITQSFVDTNLYSLRIAVLLWFMMGLVIAIIKEAVKSQSVSY